MSSALPAWIKAHRKAINAPCEQVMYRCVDGPLDGTDISLTTQPERGLFDNIDAERAAGIEPCQMISGTLPIICRGEVGAYGIMGDGTLRWQPQGRRRVEGSPIDGP